jgi:simple sugar transport system permease protein
MMTDIFTYNFLVSLLTGMVRIGTPLLLAALGELIIERSGLLNLGVEGMMLMGAFVGFVTSYYSGSLWLGVAAAAVSSALLGLIFVFMASTLKADQTVTGLALNILSSGLTFYLYRVTFKNVASENLPNIQIFTEVPVPVLSQIPVIGKVLFSQHWLTYFALLMVVVIYWFLYKTKYGLALRCLGENPRTLDMKGLSISRYQYLTVIAGAMLAGMGGSFLTLASAGLFIPDISAGRGWIAIAIVIFGNWKPFNILWASLFFGLLDSFQLQIQGIGVKFPYQILLALPYVITVVAIILSHKQSGAPISLGVPYQREEK